MNSGTGTTRTVAILTPWQDHLDLAPDYFKAVEEAQPDQLVIVDDGSNPPLEFSALRFDEPTGFCAANNAGIALVECDVTLMLNNDIAPLRRGWLEEIVALVEPGVLVGPLRFDQHGDVDEVSYPYIDGWCLAAYTEDLRSLGGLDEAYDEAGPAYYSDNALALQARLQGFRLREVRPGLHHKGGQTGGVDRERFERVLAVNKELFAEQVRAVVGNTVAA